MSLIEENLWNGFDRFTYGFLQIGFSDTFSMDVDIAEGKVFTLFSQLLCQFFSAYTIGAARAAKITANMEFS